MESNGRDILWSIIRKDERVECGRGHFLALSSGEKSGSLLDGMILDILKDMVVAFPRDVRREMANRYGYIRDLIKPYMLLLRIALRKVW